MSVNRIIDTKIQILLLRWAIFLTPVGLALTPSPIFSQPVIAPRPSWVAINDFPRLSDQEISSQSGSSYYLLIDHQTHMGSETSYFHTVVKILNSEGVQQRSDINLGYDPSYQTLNLHQLVIHRGDETINKLGKDPIRTFQRETNLERNMYDGSLTASINLSDVRIGDIIEYSFSRRGQHPGYDGHNFGAFQLDSSIPIELFMVRLLVPDGRKIAFKYTNSEIEPDVTRKAGLTTYQWKREKLKAMRYDNNVPIWYLAHTLIEYTDYKKWREVVEWALPLFEVTQPERERLRVLAREVIPFSDAPLDILKVIRFVQDDIRYLGLEHGMSAYLPHPPTQVWEQRYGDCKDKSLLLSALLRELGIEAYPMLVNSATLRSAEEYVIAPGVFDHCVVSFSYDDQQCFVDPAVSYQGGDLEHLFFSNYKFGLIISPHSYDLTPLPEPEAGRTVVTEHFTLDDAGGGTLSVNTEYRGYQADKQRSYFASNDLGIIQNRYLTYYATMYPEIEVITDISYRDDQRDTDNVIVVEESYRINNIWVQDEADTGSSHVKFYPLQLENLVLWDSSPNRTMPYYVGRVDFRHEFIIDLPELWPVTPEELTITGDGFEYWEGIYALGKQIKIVRDYQRTKNFIEAAAVTEFVTKHDRIRSNLSYYLINNPVVAEANVEVSWVMLTIALACAVGALLGAGKIYSTYDPEPKIEGLEPGVGPRGIRGWLVLPAISLVLAPFRFAADLPDYVACLDSEVLSAFGLAFSALLGFEVVFNVAFMVFWGLLTFSFFKRRSSVPVLYVSYITIFVFFTTVDAILVEQLVPDVLAGPDTELSPADIIYPLFVAAIWIPYFLRSERVKRTFVERRPSLSLPFAS